MLDISLTDARWFLGCAGRPEQAQEMPGGERVLSVHSNTTKFKGADGSGGIQCRIGAENILECPKKVSLEPEKKPEKDLCPNNACTD